MKRQQGYVLLLIIAVLGTAALGFLGAGLGKSVQQIHSGKDRKVTRQLNIIKQRLLAFTASRTDGDIGRFPCPTPREDAVANTDGRCSRTVIAGWLPREVGADNLTLIVKELPWQQVWFVLDGRYSTVGNGTTCGDMNVVSSRCAPLNTDVTPDRITLNGKEDQYVALLIYSGNPVSNSARPNSDNPNIRAYLEADNADGDHDFVTYDEDEGPFNDIVVPITFKEWERAVKSRVIAGINTQGLCFSTDDEDAWFSRDGWDGLYCN